MAPVTARLKELRKSAVPRLTVRRIAEELDMPFGTYSFYESASTFKKPHLPLEFTRKVAGVLSRHGVDPAEVMKLAGLKADEAAPEADAIEAARPSVQFITMPVVLPSEAALADMFESLLALVPAEATRAEAARILAQRLASGFAAIGPFAPDPGKVQSTVTATALQSPATDHRAPAQPSRT